jgi:hypothetical protein
MSPYRKGIALQLLARKSRMNNTSPDMVTGISANVWKCQFYGERHTVEQWCSTLLAIASGMITNIA